jgi:hypothetical protein
MVPVDTGAPVVEIDTHAVAFPVRIVMNPFVGATALSRAA